MFMHKNINILNERPYKLETHADVHVTDPYSHMDKSHNTRAPASFPLPLSSFLPSFLPCFLTSFFPSLKNIHLEMNDCRNV